MTIRDDVICCRLLGVNMIKSIDSSALSLEAGGARVALQPQNMPLSQLKTTMRTTSIALTDDSRSHLWLQLALRHTSGHSDASFDSDLSAVGAHKLPQFVDPRIARFFALSAAGRRDVSTVLWNLSQSCPHLTFAPLVYPLTALFLHFHEPQEAYQSLYSLINARDVHFMATTRADRSRDAIILIKLTNKFGVLRPRKLGADAREKLRNNALDSAFAEYLQWIFWLPFHHCVRVLDCYLIEGEKFLFRVSLALALLFQKHRNIGLTLERMRVFCEELPLTPSQLIGSALKITRLSRRDLTRAKAKAEMRSERVLYTESPIHSKSDIIVAKDYILGARIAPRRFKSSVVEWEHLDLLWEWLPERVVVREPAVVFCSAENGNSLQTFYSLCGEYEPTVLLIKTIKSQIFGAFCSTAWSRRLDLAQTKSGQYFGTGETFLFALSPHVRKHEWVGREREPQNITHSQQLFQSASARFLSIGSGGGKFGLFIDESLTRGQTDRCDTFANEPLTDSTSFDISVIVNRTPVMATTSVPCVRDISLPNASTHWSAGDDNGWDDSDGLTGLANLGNTCYQSCILQCLLNNESLLEALSSHSTSDHIIADTIADNFLQLLCLYHKQRPHSTAIRAEGIRDSMAKRHTFYGDGRQHDAQEFLALLLDALHEEWTRVRTTKRQKKETDGNDGNEDDKSVDEKRADEDWTGYRGVNNSCVVDLFAGQLSSRVVCDVCHFETTTFEPFFYLALPLPVVRQKQIVVVVTRLSGESTRCLVTVDNKYDNLIHLKNKVRQTLSLEDVVANEHLVVAELVNGVHVQRIHDDFEDILSLDDNTCEVCVFEVSASASGTESALAVCMICLEERPVSQLYSHGGTCANTSCAQCLDECVKHYADNCCRTPFACPSCAQHVSRDNFVSCVSAREPLLDIPLVFRSNADEKRLIFRALVIRVAPQMDSAQMYAIVDSRVPAPEHTYRLLFVERDGQNCCRCSWGTTCDGCEVTRDGCVALNACDTLCVAFDAPLTPALTHVLEHESMAARQSGCAAQLSLDTCLSSFMTTECLEDEWLCARCQHLRPANKSFKLIRPPNTLVVYLKRFLFISNKSFKLSESVHFPIDDPLDIGPLVAHHRPMAHLYELDSLVCHSGPSAASGHYTAFVRRRQKWFHINDESVTSERPTDGDSRAYILFYKRQAPGADTIDNSLHKQSQTVFKNSFNN